MANALRHLGDVIARSPPGPFEWADDEAISHHRMKRSFVYIMTNDFNTVLYVGVTSNLLGRVWTHKYGDQSGFTRRYRVRKLVYLEVFDDINYAIAREKQLKAGSRARKAALVERLNPEWRDLAAEFFD